jgi:hypothetical protein
MAVSFYLGNLKDGATTIDFVEDLDINMSNAKARMMLNALGIPDTDDLCGNMDRVQFANLCASWLQQVAKAISYSEAGDSGPDHPVRETLMQLPELKQRLADIESYVRQYQASETAGERRGEGAT